MDRVDIINMEKDRDGDIEYKSFLVLNINFFFITTELFKRLFSRRDGKRTVIFRNDIGADLQELHFDQEFRMWRWRCRIMK